MPSDPTGEQTHMQQKNKAKHIKAKHIKDALFHLKSCDYLNNAV